MQPKSKKKTRNSKNRNQDKTLIPEDTPIDTKNSASDSDQENQEPKPIKTDEEMVKKKREDTKEKSKEAEETPSTVPPSRKLTLDRPRSINRESWSEISASNFEVRCPPNYARNRNKAPSKEALYELTTVDVFKYDEKIDNIASRIDLPYQASSDSKHSDGDNKKKG